jgi:chromosome segregation ATPase
MAFLPRDTVRHWKEKLAELRERWRGARQEIESLRREIERLQQERERVERERDRYCANFLAVRASSILSLRDANPVRPTASIVARPFPRKMNKNRI